MSEGSQGQKGIQLTSTIYDSTDQQRVSALESGSGGGSGSSSATPATVLGALVGDRAGSASPVRVKIRSDFTPSHQPSVILHVKHLVKQLSEENYDATVRELDQLATFASSFWYHPSHRGQGRLAGTVRFFALRSILDSTASNSSKDQQEQLSSTQKDLLADQIFKSNNTDLYLVIESLEKSVSAERSRPDKEERTFKELLRDWFPSEFWHNQDSSERSSAVSPNRSCCGLALAISVGLCGGSREGSLKNSLLGSSLDYLVEQVNSSSEIGDRSKLSIEEQIILENALEVLTTHQRFTEIRVDLRSMSHTIASNENGGSSRRTESVGSAADNLARDLSSPEDLIRVLKDLGPGCTSSVGTFRDTLRETTQGSEINEQCIAQMISFVAAEVVNSARSDGSAADNSSALQDEEISNILVGTLLPNSAADAEEGEAEANSEKTGDSAHGGSHPNSSSSALSPKGGWDLDVVRTCLAEDYASPKRDWVAVASHFDFPGFDINSATELQVLLDLYKAGAHCPPPSRTLLSDWRNSRGQMNLLSQLAVAPHTVYSFDVSEVERSDLLTNFLDAKPPSTAWVCRSFLERLLILSDQPQLKEKVREVFVEGLVQCPHVLLCSLVRLQLSLAGDGTGKNESSGSVQAGAEMKNELMHDLLPYFFRPNPRHQGQAAVITAAIRHLWTISPNTVTVACIESWRSTASEPPDIRIGTALHIVGIIRLLGPDSASTILSNAKDVEFSLAIAMVAADQDVIPLTPWLTERISTMGMVFLIQFIAFVGRHYPSSAPKNVAPAANEVGELPGLISTENLATSLKVLQGLEPNVLNQPIPDIPGLPPGSPAETSTKILIGDSVKALTDACVAKHPSLRAVTSDSTDTSNDDIEETANSYFQKIYTSENGLTEVVQMLKKFKTSGNARENDIFACMIHNLFDEYRFFSRYPEKELRITGMLFGMLIREQLVSSITLGIALRYVLEALRKPPGDGTNSNSGKMFRFGMFALEQFKERLHEWPQYCSHIVQIPHLKQGYADLVAEIDEAMEESQASKSAGSRGNTADGDDSGRVAVPAREDNSSEKASGSGDDGRVSEGALTGSAPSSPRSHTSIGPGDMSMQPPLTIGDKSRSGSEEEQMQILPNGLLGPGDISSGLSIGSTNSGELTPSVLSLKTEAHQNEARKVAVFGPGLGRAVNDTDTEQQHDAPSDAIVDRVQFIINNMSPSNVESKAQELKDLLPSEHFGWLGNYLVVKRISTQPNFHSLYLSFLDQLGDYGAGLVEAILASVYVNVGKLLRSPKITTSTSERSLLKNLGSWLGQITLARNRPILQIILDCKELLYQGYETGMLIAVTPFVAKILEGAKNSFVFRPPNPWLMGLLGVFRALYDVDDLKMNIKFEVEVLCKNLGLKVDDIPPRMDDLAKRIPPVKERNPDFNVKSGTSSGVASPGGIVVGLPPSPGGKDTAPAPEIRPPSVDPSDAPASDERSQGDQQQQTVIPNLASYVTINPSLAQLFQQVQGGTNISAAVLKRTVPLAVDRAIREIIQPVVERSVTIACITTKEIVTKDFAMESDENKMRKAAQLMVANLAGSLALVTCREPLRASVSTHLRQLLVAVASGTSGGSSGTSSNQVGEEEQNAIEQCVTICATDNLDLGCMLIEKAATEKAVRDMDEALAPALQARRKHREQTGQPFYDMSIFGSGSHRYPAALPEPLRPKPGGGLRPEQLLVYEAFQRVPRQPVVAGAPAQIVNVNVPGSVRNDGRGDAAGDASGGLTGSSILTSGGGGTVNQQFGLEALSSIATKLNSAVTTVLTATGPRASEVTLALLPPDHEIRQLLLAVKRAASSSQATRPLNKAEMEAVLGFAQSVFKRLYELSLSEPLRLEVFVALLEGLNECCPQLSQDMGTWATYAPTETDAQRQLHRTILLLLVRSRLIPVSEVDDFLAKSVDNGRNAIWLEFALLFVRHAVADRIATTSDMPKLMDILAKIGEGRALTSQTNTNAFIKPVNRLLEELRNVPGGLAPSDPQAPALSGLEVGFGATAGDNKGMQRMAQPHGSSTYASLSSLADATESAADANALTARNDPPGMRQQVTFLLDSWIRINSEAQGNEKVMVQYLQLLQQHGVGKVEDQTERFVRHSTELVVEAVLKSAQPIGARDSSNKQPPSSIQGTVLNYSVADAYSKLVVLLIRYMNGGGTQEEVAVQRIAMVNKVLGITMRTLMTSYERSKQGSLVGAHWDQRPWFRILMNMIHDLNSPSPVFDPISLGILNVFGSAFHVVQPLVVPGFAFAWLELISHRMFLSNLLLAKDQKGWGIAHQLLIDLFLFLEPHLRKTELTEAVKHLYKGTLRVLLVLLHDFPSFLAGYHLSLCNVIPDNCVQLRNLVLSAFPRGMVLPDPFTPNLKIDLLPEIAKSPVLLSNVAGPLGSIRADLDSYLKSRHPAGFVSDLFPRLYKEGTNDVDVPRVNSLVLYVGIQAIARLQNSQIAHTPEMEVIQKLMDFDDRGRYVSLNAIANQLRYPSSHTHYFSCVMLFLFSEAKHEGVKEQITRVLLERLIVHRPHPWGLLITFIELIKNQRYQFWSHPFTRCATEIEKVFESVARSCMTPAARSATTAGDPS